MKQLLLLLICSIFTPFSLAQIINVPNDQPTMQAAIDFSVDGDTVLVTEGTYYETIDFNGKDQLIVGNFI